MAIRLRVGNQSDINLNYDEAYVLAVSPTAVIEQTDTGATITVTDKNGTTTATLTNGQDGSDGQDGQDGSDGADGIGVASVVQTSTSTEDGGINTIKVTLTDGTATNFYIQNGSRGSQGETGLTGATGETGNGIASAVLNSDYTLTLTFTDGTSYTTGSIRGEQGEQGIQGERGEQGEAGSDASVTAENIASALGYIPADEADIPTVPTNVSAFTNDSGYLTEHQDISGKVNVSDLATVATSGSYNDLSDTPTIPTIPDIETSADYTTWGSGNLVESSALASGIRYLIQQILAVYDSIPTVPTDVSAFNNDAGYLTDVQINGTSITLGGVANIPLATSSVNGVMSATDKTNLDILVADYSSALTALGVI